MNENPDSSAAPPAPCHADIYKWLKSGSERPGAGLNLSRRNEGRKGGGGAGARGRLPSATIKIGLGLPSFLLSFLHPSPWKPRLPDGKI